MTTDTTFDVIAALGTGGIAALAAAAVGQVRQARAVAAVERHAAAYVPTPDQAVYRACHSLICGHLETPHDPTPVGYVCRNCTRTEAL